MASKAISMAATHYLQYEIQWSSLALLYYDYALTFPMEVRYIWKDKFRLSTVLYIFCRYAMVANVLYLLAISGKLTDNCDAWYKLLGALSVLGRAAVLITFTGRVYAVWSQNKLILVYLGLLGLSCIAFDITHVPGLRCVGSSSIPIVNHLLSIFMAVFEFSSVILTAVRSIQAFRARSASFGSKKGGLLYVIFEQGILYFLIMSAFTIATVVLIYRSSAGFFQRLLNAITLPLSGMLTARFLLHVRRWDYERTGAGAATRTRAGSAFDSSGNTVVFRAAGLMSTIVDEFGTDPVARSCATGTLGIRDIWDDGTVLDSLNTISNIESGEKEMNSGSEDRQV